jgi:hypothetical protein
MIDACATGLTQPSPVLTSSTQRSPRRQEMTMTLTGQETSGRGRTIAG